MVFFCYTLNMSSMPLLPSSTWKSVPPSPLNLYPKTIQELIRRLRTPYQVQRWIHVLQYNKQDTLRTLRGVAQRKRAHCLEAALAAATILEHRGFPPLILDLESADQLDHTLFLYRQNGKFGTIGLSRDVGLAGRQPVYQNLRTLAQSYAAPYIDHKAALTGYGVLDLRTLHSVAWRFSSGNIWFVEEALRNIPHRHLKLSRQFLHTWRQRYLLFRKRHPTKQPDFYLGQHRWA